MSAQLCHRNWHPFLFSSFLFFFPQFFLIVFLFFFVYFFKVSASCFPAQTVPAAWREGYETRDLCQFSLCSALWEKVMQFRYKERKKLFWISFEGVFVGSFNFLAILKWGLPSEVVWMEIDCGLLLLVSFEGIDWYPSV